MTRQEKRRQNKASARTATIRRTGTYTFEIDSRTRPGHTHTIDALRLQCSCEAGQQGMRCWALALALMVEQGYRVITPKRARGARRADAARPRAHPARRCRRPARSLRGLTSYKKSGRGNKAPAHYQPDHGKDTSR